MFDQPIPHECLRLPLTPAQIDIWLEQSVHPKSTKFNVAHYYLIPLALDTERFLAAADWVFSHYDALYARLVQGPAGVPEVLFDPSKAPRCEYLDLSGEADPDKALQAFVVRHAHTPFQMLEASLCRPVLVKTGEQGFCYCCNHHHVLADGWATGIVFNRIAAAYENLGKGVALAVEGGRFADYLKTCQAPESSLSFEKAREFWKPLLAAPIPSIAPLHGSGEGQDELSASHIRFTLPRALADRVTAQAAASNATLYHALLLAYSHLLGRMYGLESSTLSLPILNRSKEHKETVGLFVEVRVTPLPTDETLSVGENLNAIARRIRELFRHYHLPAAELTRLYQSQGNSGNPASHSTLSYVTRDFGASIDGVFLPMVNVPSAHAKEPFAFFVLDIFPGRDSAVELIYQHRYMNAAEAALFADRLLHLLEKFADDPGGKLGEIDLVPPGERRKITALLRREGEGFPATHPVIDDIVERAGRCPEAIAVETGTVPCSYRECLEKARGLARTLVERHAVRPGDRVALLLPRGAELIWSELAVMLTGAAFVPIDPQYPELRMRQIHEDSGARCLITDASLAEKAGALVATVLLTEAVEGSAEPFTSLAAYEKTAYIIYTSGSTGRPKGVEVSHRALAEHVANWSRTVRIREGCERALFFHSPSFDACLETIYPALMQGNTLVVAPHPQWTIFEIARVIVERRLNILFLPPAYLLEFLRLMREQPGRLAGHQVRMCLTGGETMHAETAPLWEAVFGASAKLFNIYGPTECTVTSNCFELPAGYRAEPGESIPIGLPYAGRAARIVDQRGLEVPIGIEGELLVGGIGLATGYHGMPDKTDARFVTLEDGMRYYRTGDVVRLKSDGTLIFRRRLDQQVKIRGFRIEPAEIEACLQDHPSARECAVVATKDKDGADELTAYAVLSPGSGESSLSLRRFMLTRLPEYMVPPVLLLEHLPRNASGKIDRKALAAQRAVQAQPAPAAQAGNPAQGVVQEYLVLLWEKTLGRKIDDVQAGFFELGGHSLLAAGLISNVSKAFRVEYPFAAFFEMPTIVDTERNLEQLVGDRTRLEKMARVRMELARMSPDEMKAKLESAGRKPPQG
jgi:amino acid adenylation domain-containing protein